MKRTAEAIKTNGAPVETVELQGSRGHLDGDQRVPREGATRKAKSERYLAANERG